MLLAEYLLYGFLSNSKLQGSQNYEVWILYYGYFLGACTCYHRRPRFIITNEVWLSFQLSKYPILSPIDFEAAERVFDDIRRRDPFRVDNIDVFSNILYVMENRTKLSKLAHEFLALNKERPEVCCIVGKFFFDFSLCSILIHHTSRESLQLAC